MFKKLLGLFKKPDIKKTRQDIEYMVTIVAAADELGFRNQDTPVEIMWNPGDGYAITHKHIRVAEMNLSGAYQSFRLTEFGMDTDVWFNDFMDLYILAGEYLDEIDRKKEEYNKQLYKSFEKINKVLQDEKLP